MSRRQRKPINKKINRAINKGSRAFDIEIARKATYAAQRKPNTRRPVPRQRRANNNRTGKTSIGSLLGRGIDTVIKHVSGFGDYSIGYNSLMRGGDPPTVRNSMGGIIVRHREYLGDVLASTSFNVNTYLINAGLFQTFPWLSAVALSFEQYRMRGLIFEFKSLSSDAVLSSATSSALGAVVMATQYDVLDDIFQSKFEMENYQFANSAKPSMSFYHPVECAKSQTTITELYVRGGVLPSNSDQRLYDLGRFSVATVGMQASSGVAGELWCTYEIELLKPKFTEDAGTNILSEHWQLLPTNANPLATPSLIAGSIGTSISTNTLIFPNNITSGYTFYVSYTCTGSSVTLTAPAITGARCTFLPYFSGPLTSFVSPPSGSTTTTFTTQFVVQTTGIAPQIAFGVSGTLPSSATGGDLSIMQINNALYKSVRNRPLVIQPEESDDDSNAHHEEELERAYRQLSLISGDRKSVV